MGEVLPMFPTQEKKPEVLTGVDILVKQKDLLQGTISKNQQIALAFDADSSERRFYDRQNDMLREEQTRVMFFLSHYQETLEEEIVHSLTNQLQNGEKKDGELVGKVKGKIEQMNGFIRVLEEYRIDDEALREKKRRTELEVALFAYEQ